MGYSGSLGGVDLASALQVLGPAGRSGIATVTKGEKSAMFMLEQGELIYASCDEAGLLGERLVEKGVVSQAALDSVLTIQRRSRRQLLGHLLVSLGLVDKTEMSAEIEAHIVRVLAVTLAWEEPAIHFDEALGDVSEIVPPFRGSIPDLLMRVVTG